jgi:hypothetical protein
MCPDGDLPSAAGAEFAFTFVHSAAFVAGIAVMKKITVAFPPVIGFPSWPVSFTRTIVLPLPCARNRLN